MEDTKTKQLKILRYARNYLSDEANWLKGRYSPNGVSHLEQHGGPACAEGALMKAQHDLKLKNVQIFAQFEAVVQANSRFGGTLSFNDSPGTTHLDVLSMFDLAIEELSK